jgi:hypothetical protein
MDLVLVEGNCVLKNDSILNGLLRFIVTNTIRNMILDRCFQID